ncbi:MAG: HRDC domain-containing protein, partial [Melioribacteraceae bacterium]
EYFIASSSPARQQIEDVYQLICDYGKVAVGNVSDKEIPLDKNFLSLIATKKINQALTNASIKILEESGYIRHRSDFENKHYGQFLLEPNRLNQFAKSFTDAELKDLILLLAREYGSKIFNSKTQLGIERLSKLLEISEDSIINLLQTLSRAGIFSYEIPSLFPSVKLILPRIEAKRLQLNLEKTRLLTEHAKTKLEKIISYAFTDQCRFKFILEYFGQFDTNYKCGKCDVCTGSIQASATTLEYLEEIILQTVHESKKPIKKKNLIQILTGKTDLASMKKFSTFNTCTHFSKDEIEISISKLNNAGLLHSTNDVLSLSGKGVSTFLVTENETAPLITDGKYEEELKLFNLLRQIRKEAADKFGQHANLICSDEILREIVRLKPKTHSDLLNVNGFNQRMFNKIGDEFLNVIQTSDDSKNLNILLKQKKIPENILKVFDLVQKKYSLADIASLTKLPESIVSTQIETLIEMQPNLEIDFLFEKNELKEIYKIINNGTTDLKSLREAFNNKISYAKLRIAAAKRRVN